MNSPEIIVRFGGIRALARLLDVPHSTVQHWKDSGRIPAQHQQRVLEIGRELAPPLTPADFFAADNSEAAE